MKRSIEKMSLLEIAALWRLNFLSAEDISAVCMRLLEEGLDSADRRIAAFAGDSGLILSDIAPHFERILVSVNGRAIGRDEAILRILRLDLAAALAGYDLKDDVHLLLSRFASLSEHRLVRHPRRTLDQPDGVYAEQELGLGLGLEYVYGGFYAFDDIWHLSAQEQEVAKAELLDDLRKAVGELPDHLSVVLGAESRLT